jgi:hypothetical protein
LIELAGGGVKCDADFFSGLVASLLDGFEDQIDRLTFDFTEGAKPPSSPTAVL